MRLDLDGVLVLACLAFLLLLGAASDRPFFEGLAASRLTYLSFLGLPLFVALGLLRRRWERTAAMARDWWQVIGVLLVYENLKHQHANRITEWLGISPKDLVMLRVDEALFGKCLALWFDTPFFAGELSHVLWFFYIWVYYLGPIVLLGWAYFALEDDVLFRLLRRSLVFGLLGGYVFYILVPVAGPLFVIGDRFTVPILTQPTLQTLAFSTLRYNWDCFPSLHTAIPWLLTLTAWPRLPRAGRALAVAAASGVTLSTVALRFHYGIDLVAGIAWAVLVFAVLRRFPALGELGVTLPRLGPAGRAAPSAVALVPAALVASTGFVVVLAAQGAAQLLASLFGSGNGAAPESLPVALLGLAGGGLAYGRWIRPRGARSVTVQAALAGGVAFGSLLLYLGYERLLSAWGLLAQATFDSKLLSHALRILVAAAWIGPFAVLAGTALPAAVEALDRPARGALRHPGALAWTLGLLGSAAGVVFGGWFAFPRWGVGGTLLFAYASGGVVALVALRNGLSAAASGPPRPAVSVPRSRAFALTAFSAGFLALGQYAVSVNVARAVFGSTVYAAAATDALLLAGLALGGAAATLLVPAGRLLSGRTLGSLLIGGALLLAWQQIQWPDVPRALAAWGAARESFAAAELARWAVAAPLLLPGAAVLGALLAALLRHERLAGEDRAGSAGRLLAAAAAGGLLGVLPAAWALVPSLGSEATLLLLAMAAAALAPAAAFADLGRRGRFGITVAAAGTIGLLSLLPPWDELSVPSGGRYSARGGGADSSAELRFLREDARQGITAIVRDSGGPGGRPRLVLLDNGNVRGSAPPTGAASTGIPLAAILHAPRREAALVLGLGTARTVAVAGACGFRRVDVAEPSRGVVEASRLHLDGPGGEVLGRPGVRISVEDPRAFLLGRNGTYDYVSLEFPDAWAAGSGSLLSREFYEIVASRLAPSGLFQQRVPLDHLGPLELGSMVATLRSVLPHVSVWCVGGEAFALASRTTQAVRGEALPAVREGAERLGVPRGDVDVFLRSLLLSRVLTPEDTLSFASSVRFPLGTDANRFLEYASPRFAFGRLELYAKNLGFLAAYGTFGPVRVSGFVPGSVPGWLRETGRAASLDVLGFAPEAPAPAAPGPAAGAARGD
jgi:hypothetical protein